MEKKNRDPEIGLFTKLERYGGIYWERSNSVRTSLGKRTAFRNTRKMRKRDMLSRKENVIYLRDKTVYALVKTKSASAASLGGKYLW